MQLVLMEDQALGKLPPAAQCWVGPKGLEFVDHRTLGPLVVLVLEHLENTHYVTLSVETAPGREGKSSESGTVLLLHPACE